MVGFSEEEREDEGFAFGLDWIMRVNIGLRYSLKVICEKMERNMLL